MTSPTALPPPAPAPAPVMPPQPPAHRAQVAYANGQLQVTADNSSLNQILRDIGSQTGMKIVGSVTDQRVFGEYGPGAPAEILADLLDGTGCNMLLRDTAANVPAELVLTPQGGGPTPPNPNARNFDDDAPEQPEPPTPVAQAPPPRPEYTPPPPPAAVTTAPEANSAGGSPSPGANPPSPNGVQTPQQIYEQLQRLQQAQPQTPANPQ